MYISDVTHILEQVVAIWLGSQVERHNTALQMLIPQSQMAEQRYVHTTATQM